jgi:DNA uptake protein ComE-like DNA-binding protein
MSKNYGETIRFYLVDVKDIVSTELRSQFDAGQLEQLADLILETGCLLKPLLLKQKSPVRYEVLEGHFEYHAAVRANEKDAQRFLGGMVSAFVIKQEVEKPAISQAKIVNQTISTPTSKTEVVSTDSNVLEHRMNNLESRLENELQAIRTTSEQNTQQLKAAIEHSHAQLSDALNTLITTATQPAQLPSSDTHNPLITQDNTEARILEALNTWSAAELIFRLKTVGVGKKMVEKIISERGKSPFKSLGEVTARKFGIGPKTMAQIVGASYSK